MVLPLRIEPFPDESLLGFLFRLAERNGHSSPFCVLAHAGVNLRAIEPFVSRGMRLDALAHASGVSLETLRKMSYAAEPERPGRRFLGHEFGGDQFLLHTRRACPICLAQSPHHRAFWDLAVVTACPQHRVHLINVCQSCGRRLRWEMPLTKCRCGAAIHRMVPVSLPDENLDGLRMVYASVGGWTKKVPSILTDLGPDHFIRLMVGLGWFIHLQRGRPRIQQLAAYSGTPALLTDGWRACTAWPNSFHEYLDDLRTQAHLRPGPGKFGVSKEFGPLLDWTAKVAPPSLRHLLFAELRFFFQTKGAFITRSSWVFSPKNAELISIAAAARILGYDPEKVRKTFLRHGIAQIPFGRGKGAPQMVPRFMVHSVANDLKDLIGKTALHRVLGCSRKDADAVLSTGLLPEVPHSVTRDLFGHRAWRRSDIGAAIAALEQPSKVGDRTINLPRAFAMLRQVGISVPDVIIAVQKGRLPVTDVDPDAMGLRRLRIGMDAVHRLVKAKRAKAGTMTLEEVAAHLQVKRQVAHELVDAGMLRTCTPALKRGRLVERTEVEAFQAHYVIASQLGLDAGHHRGWAADRLIAAGIAPVSGPRVDGRRQYVFRRQDVAAWIAVKDRVGLS